MDKPKIDISKMLNNIQKSSQIASYFSQGCPEKAYSALLNRDLTEQEINFVRRAAFSRSPI